MKICAIISEYNPLHSGHAYHIRQAKEQSNTDFVLCIMSGNFVQRGESAVLDKYERAAHAIKAGADAVIELPTVFATSPAEFFAKGGVKIANAIPSVTHLSFGAETPDERAFYKTATLLNNEPKEISQKIKQGLSQGKSFVKARSEAYENDLLLSPNNLLGVEYTRAILSLSSKIKILPVQRVGAGYKSSDLSDDFPSATAVRKALFDGELEKVKSNLPDDVYQSLLKAKNVDFMLNLLEKHAILSKSAEELRKINDCTEGLENALLKVAETTLDVVEELTSARYTSSRIRRILLHSLFGIKKEDILSGLQSDLYLRLLAAKKNSPILSLLGESDYPLIVSGPDENLLSGVAKKIHTFDTRAKTIYSLLTDETPDKKIFY